MENDELLKLLQAITKEAASIVEQPQTPMEKRAHELAADLKQRGIQQ